MSAPRDRAEAPEGAGRGEGKSMSEQNQIAVFKRRGLLPRTPTYANTLEDYEECDSIASDALPPPLRMRGALQSRLASARHRAGGTLTRVAARLQTALDELREECRRQARSASPPPMPDDRRWVLWLGERPSREEGPAALVRLLVMRELTGATPDAVIQAGIEAYREEREAYARLLGEALSDFAEYAVMAEDYATGAGPTALHDWPMFAVGLNGQRRSPMPGLGTGLAAFDALTGGLCDLSILAGEPGSGKSALALQMALGALRADARLAVLFLDTEMGKDAVYRRLLCHESGVALRRIVAPDRSDEENGPIRAASARLQAEVLSRLRVIDRATHSRAEPITPQWFFREIDQFLSHTKLDRCLIVVDSLNRMAVGDFVDSHDDRGLTRYHRPTDLEATSARMELLLAVQRWSRGRAGPSGFPVLAVARCRKKEGRAGLELADVLGGADVTYDAQAVYLLEARPSANPDVTPTLLSVAKNRDWGCRSALELDFHHTVLAFRPAEGSSAPAQPKAASAKARSKRFGGKA